MSFPRVLASIREYSINWNSCFSENLLDYYRILEYYASTGMIACCGRMGIVGVGSPDGASQRKEFH